MRKIIDSLDGSPESNTFIIDAKGVMVIGDRKNPMLTDISGEKYVKDILSSKKTSGYFIENIDGEKSLISYMSSDFADWKFIRITPYKFIISKIDKVKYTTLLIGICILLAGFAVSFLISQRLYKPIGSLLTELKSLKDEKRNSLYASKQEFLRNILQNKLEHDNVDIIQKRLEDCEIKFDIRKPFSLLLLKIDHFTDFCNKYNFNDRSLIKFGVMNIASELCTDKFPNEPVDIGDDHIVLLSNTCDSDLPESHLFEELIKNIQTSVKNNLQISLSIIVSSTGKTLNDAKHLYDEAVNASDYRLFYGHNCIIYSNSVKELQSKDYTYPLQSEKLLIDALMLGKIVESKRLYSELIQSTNGYSYNIFHTNILRLAIAINSVIDSIEKNSGIYIFHNLNSFIMELSKFETIEDVNSYFFDQFERITAELDKRKNAKHDQLISMVINTIYKDYSNQNITLESIADSVDMSPVYLGRLFKKLTSKSISEYISEVRLKKAKELLTTSDNSINEISEKTGFISSKYFYTLFKKMNGVTPNEYRQNNRNS